MADDSKKPSQEEIQALLDQADPRVPGTYPGMQGVLANYGRVFEHPPKSNAPEQSERSTEKATVPDPEGARELFPDNFSMPRNWREWRPWIAWGGLVIAFCFAFVDRLVQQHYGEALIALLGGLAVSVVALHSKAWLERTNPNWAYAGALALLLAVFLSPFIEEKRWPFSAWFPNLVHDHGTPQQVDEKMAALQGKLDAANREIAAKNQQIQNLLHPPPAPAPPPPPKPHYSADEIAIIQTALRGMYAVVTTECKPALDADRQLLTAWDQQADSINSDPRAFAYRLINHRDALRQCSAGLRKIVDSNGLYANELNEVVSTDYGYTLVSVLDAFIRDLDELGKSPVKLDVHNLLVEDWKQWGGSSKAYEAWVGTASHTVTKKIEEFRDWHN